MNLSPLCHLDSAEQPYLWAENVARLYSEENIPGYVEKITNNKVNMEKDLAVVNFYFSSPTTMGELFSAG